MSDDNKTPDTIKIREDSVVGPDQGPDASRYGTIAVAHPRPLPEVLDILIAGGGPGGTAAAMRAAELDLQILVIDADDLLSTIRDFGPTKKVEPDYGGGDDQPFPPGGRLIDSLAFSTVEVQAMLPQWRRRYRDNNISARVGSELTGLERANDGIWLVKTWNHRERADVSYRARHVIIALGAGSPRRFEIPGDLSGIDFRLGDPERYVGGPALVVGGGISAAEAVIAISNAKARANDDSPVYWSYYGQKLPRVAESRPLGMQFFDAYVGNGNIRYLPGSDAAAVFARSDGQYLLVCTDRKVIPGRPAESVHLEFPKERVVACIGKEQPIASIKSLGAQTVHYKNREYVLLNGDGELSLPGVFLVGAARGDRHIQCSAFADPSTYALTRKQSYNIKLAMWDGALAAETVAVRAGKQGAKVALLAAPRREAKAVTPDSDKAAPAAEKAAPPVRAKGALRAPAAPASIVPPAAVPETPARVAGGVEIEMLLPDGSVEREFPFNKDTMTIGRVGADISCPEDARLANVHASITRRDGAYLLADASTESGTWLRLQANVARQLAARDLLWMGSQIVMAVPSKRGWAIAHYDPKGAFQATYPVGEQGLMVGRATPAQLDPKDITLSRRHAQFHTDGKGLTVLDLASANGTYIKITAPTPLRSGDEFHVGSKRFRLDTGEGDSNLDAEDIRVETPPAPSAEPRAPTPAPGVPLPAGQPVVEWVHPTYGCTFNVPEGQCVLKSFRSVNDAWLKKPRKNDLNWECKQGICGLCVVQVIEGAENIEPAVPTSKERDTLRDRAGVDPDPSRFRLACLVRPRGPVRLGMVDED
jgi:thioredoxin reductase/ferredoxin/pSer/pThr/pTyr-binding forkhead associated (FHA) protein